MFLQTLILINLNSSLFMAKNNSSFSFVGKSVANGKILDNLFN